ncbi:ATP synthase F1 subunit epsilon [Candidatus Marinamargulisbacteria bacterium SCGC AG-410-N11]|nr:ATP synthase F1 subunit epsilon [Candidatus Marinamargulisbacteria bacterium SCGC AG-410-N11]
MKTNFNLVIVTPEAEVLNETVSFLKFFNSNGEVGVLPNHSSTISNITICSIEYKQEANDSVKKLYIEDGVVKISKTKVLILSPEVKSIDDFDITKVSEELKKVTNSYNNSINYDEKVKYLARIKQLEAQVSLK